MSGEIIKAHYEELKMKELREETRILMQSCDVFKKNYKIVELYDDYGIELIKTEGGTLTSPSKFFEEAENISMFEKKKLNNETETINSIFLSSLNVIDRIKAKQEYLKVVANTINSDGEIKMIEFYGKKNNFCLIICEKSMESEGLKIKKNDLVLCF